MFKAFNDFTGILVQPPKQPHGYWLKDPPLSLQLKCQTSAISLDISYQISQTVNDHRQFG